MTESANPYDLVPYVSLPFRQTHPNRLATVATLMGLSPPPVATCRMLELGCGRGDNLLPLALELPDAELLGIDLSERHVDMARQAVQSMAVGNLRIQQGDIGALPEDLGEFDFVVAHGVYSWLPETVREALMAAIRRHLAPAGVAYVSYNTFPGWRQRGVARDALLFHTRSVSDPRQRIVESQRFVEFMGRAVPAHLTAYRELWAGLLDRIASPAAREALLFHDFLEPDNTPVYVTQFLAHAERHGLRFVAEARLGDSTAELLGAEAAERLRALGDDVASREQYLDFLCNRTFRQTLLCHTALQPATRPLADAVARLRVAAELRAEDASAPLGDDAMMRFEKDDTVVGITAPVAKAALLELRSQWPRHLAFDELLARARARLYGAGLRLVDPARWQEQPAVLGGELLELYQAGLLELDIAPPRFAGTLPAHPLGSPWARRQVAAGEVISNLRHNGVELDPLASALLTLMDGSRDHETLAQDLAVHAQERGLLCESGRALAPGEEALAAVRRRLPAMLERLVALALVVGPRRP